MEITLSDRAIRPARRLPARRRALAGPSLEDVLPENPDVNADGIVDDAELAVLDAIVAEWSAENGLALEVADEISE